MDATSGDPVGYVSGATYAPHGEIAQMPFGECESRGWTGRKRRVSSRPSPVIRDEAGRQRTFCYDALGRLTSVAEDPAALNYTTTYTYDALGNLSSVNQPGNNPSAAR